MTQRRWEEQALVGACLRGTADQVRSVDWLDHDAVTDPALWHVLRACREVALTAPDGYGVETVAAMLQERLRAEQYGGVNLLLDLHALDWAQPVMVGYYAEQVAEAHVVDQAVEKITRMRQQVMAGTDVRERIALVQEEARGLLDLTLERRRRPKGTTADKLLTAEFEPIRWVVDGLIPLGGLAMIAGPPKAGKSMTALDLALGVSLGGSAMSALTCQPGEVLFLALDNDSARRLQDRMRWLLGGSLETLPGLEMHLTWSTEVRAVADCREWVDEVRSRDGTPTLVVVDTLVKVEPRMEGGRHDNSYAATTQTLTRWAQFAISADVAVLAVHHDRKTDDEDWVNRVMGSRGVTATAHTLMLLDAKRGAPTGLLRVVGRDVGDHDLNLLRTGRCWKVRA